VDFLLVSRINTILKTCAADRERISAGVQVASSRMLKSRLSILFPSSKDSEIWRESRDSSSAGSVPDVALRLISISSRINFRKFSNTSSLRFICKSRNGAQRKKVWVLYQTMSRPIRSHPKTEAKMHIVNSEIDADLSRYQKGTNEEINLNVKL